MSDDNKTPEPQRAHQTTNKPESDKPRAAAPQPKPAAAPAGDASPTGMSEDDLASAMEPEIPGAQLRDIIKALQGELDQYRDNFLRARAETDNVRKRMEREKEDVGKYAVTKFARDIVSIGDNFQRALSSVPADAIEQPGIKALVDGVSMIEKEFLSALSRHNIKPIDPRGEAFNPHQHQAVMEVEDRTVATGTVTQVFQCGYLLEDRVLRPAMVVVAKGGPKPGQTPAPDAPGNETSGASSDGLQNGGAREAG